MTYLDDAVTPFLQYTEMIHRTVINKNKNTIERFDSISNG